MGYGGVNTDVMGFHRHILHHDIRLTMTINYPSIMFGYPDQVRVIHLDISATWISVLLFCNSFDSNSIQETWTIENAVINVVTAQESQFGNDVYPSS